VSKKKDRKPACSSLVSNLEMVLHGQLHINHAAVSGRCPMAPEVQCPDLESFGVELRYNLGMGPDVAFSILPKPVL
jgi:hypothetical protein